MWLCCTLRWYSKRRQGQCLLYCTMRWEVCLNRPKYPDACMFMRSLLDLPARSIAGHNDPYLTQPYKMSACLVRIYSSFIIVKSLNMFKHMLQRRRVMMVLQVLLPQKWSVSLKGENAIFMWDYCFKDQIIFWLSKLYKNCCVQVHY